MEGQHRGANLGCGEVLGDAVLVRIEDLTAQATILNRHKLTRQRHKRRSQSVLGGPYLEKVLKRPGGLTGAHCANEVVERVHFARTLRPKAELVNRVAHIQVSVFSDLRISQRISH